MLVIVVVRRPREKEMMLLFHEIYPRNYSVDWNVVARIVSANPPSLFPCPFLSATQPAIQGST